MKILVTSVSAHGHLLPMAPLMQAALDAGHGVAVMVSADLETLVHTDLPDGIQFLPAGPMPFTLATEAVRRTGEDVMQPSVTGIGETFGGVLLDLSSDDAVRAAQGFAPDVVVADMYSTLGEFLAATLDVPWFSFALSVPLPQDWREAIDHAAAQRFTAAGLSRRAPAATLDIWPLHPVPPSDEVRLRTNAHRRRVRTDDGNGPHVLLTLGTTFSDAELLTDLATRLTATGIEVVATRGMLLGQTPTATPQEPLPGVRWVPFTPVDELLDGATAVVSVGGAGAGLVVDRPEDVPTALTQLLADATFRDAAARVAATIATAATPDDIVRTVLEPALG